MIRALKQLVAKLYRPIIIHVIASLSFHFDVNYLTNLLQRVCAVCRNRNSEENNWREE